MICMACKNKGKDDDDFIEIEGTFIISRPRDYGPDDIDRISLHACVRCGTIRMDAWYIYNIQNIDEVPE